MQLKNCNIQVRKTFLFINQWLLSEHIQLPKDFILKKTVLFVYRLKSQLWLFLA